MPGDQVGDDEELYRRVPHDPSFFTNVDGRLRISSSAFNDPGQKPSVDRAKLRAGPHETKKHLTDGIVLLAANEVRAIRDISRSGNAAPSVYEIDVIPRPIVQGNPQGEPENLAHAQIEANPTFETQGRFKKLKEKLALLASQRGWLVTPS